MTPRSPSGAGPDPHGREAPHPDHPAKPDTPDDLTRRSWTYVVRKTGREFVRDQCTDIAAALTYYAVLALFPAMIALLSIIGLVGRDGEAVDTITQILRDVGASSVATTVEPTLDQLARSSGAGLALALSLLAALWSASGYTSAFGRAMNRTYEVGEGRPFWKFRPLMILLTAVLLLLAAAVVLGLVLTGPAASAIGSAMGVGPTALMVWRVAKWPVMLAAVVLAVALLYWGTPNLKQPRFRWVSIGSVIAILVWAAASLAFGFYVANFASYNRTYGTLAGVVVFLLWLWLTNLALLFGAEFDAELERGRQLQAGIRAEEDIQLPPRDTSKIEQDEARRRDEIERGRRLRETRGADTEPPEGRHRATEQQP